MAKTLRSNAKLVILGDSDQVILPSLTVGEGEGLPDQVILPHLSPDSPPLRLGLVWHSKDRGNMLRGDCLVIFLFRWKVRVSPAADSVVVVMRIPVARRVNEDTIPGAEVPLHGVLTAPRALPPDPLQPVVQHRHCVPSLLL